MSTLKYKSDGKFHVWAGKMLIAKSFVGENGYEVKIKQGMPRMEVVEKIFKYVPEFAANNHMDKNIYPKLF